jgi:hypothetical protein
MKGNGKTASVGTVVTQLNAEIERLRATREALLAEYAAVESQPIAAEEVPGRVDEVITTLQARSADVLLSGFLHGESTARELVDSMLVPSTKPLVLAAVLVPDVLRSYLLTEAEAEMRRLPSPLPSSARAKRLKELETQVLETERAEAVLLWEGERAGLTMPWRHDIDEKAVLGL